MMIVLIGKATPSLYHVIFGIGTPRAEQFTRTGVSNSFTVTVLGGMIFTATGSRKKKERNYNGRVLINSEDKTTVWDHSNKRFIASKRNKEVIDK